MNYDIDTFSPFVKASHKEAGYNKAQKQYELQAELFGELDFFDFLQSDEEQNSYEEIRQKATKEQVTLKTAQEFVQGLSTQELMILQKNAGLASEIDASALNDEEALNLLLKRGERYDWNSDGVMEVGAANNAVMIPQNMPIEQKRALVQIANESGNMGLDSAWSMYALSSSGAINLTMSGGDFENTQQNREYMGGWNDTTLADFKVAVDTITDPANGNYTAQQKEKYADFWDKIVQKLPNIEQNIEKEVQSKKASQAQLSGETLPSALAQLLEQLREKGASAFLMELSAQKIEEKVEEYEQKLLSENEQKSENSKLTKDMQNTKEAPKTTAQIDEMVNEYRKYLQEMLQQKTKNEEQVRVKKGLNLEEIIKRMV